MEDDVTEGSSERENPVTSKQESEEFEYYAKRGKEYGLSPEQSQAVSLFL